MSEQFFRSNRPGYPHPVSSELELVVSEWRSVIAVSLNVGGGVRLIKPAKLYMCTQTLQTQRGRTHGAGCVRQWFRTAELLGERRYENWNTHTHCRNSWRYAPASRIFPFACWDCRLWFSRWRTTVSKHPERHSANFLNQNSFTELAERCSDWIWKLSFTTVDKIS